jgi:predicted transcriptional regulator of viral defense system
MTTLLKPLRVRKELLSKNIQFFSPMWFERIFQVSPTQAKYFLEEQSKTGLFLRLKKGLYTLETDVPSEEETANRLYQPSYISLEYALAFYSIIPEAVYQVTSVTTKPTREFDVQGKPFSYSTIKREAYIGYRMVQTVSTSFQIAEPEKALVDYLYFVALGKRGHNDRIRTRSLNKAGPLSMPATLIETD